MTSLRIAMLGTRGVPAAYGGFETAVEEIGARLADRGHRVTVYCRSASASRHSEWRGMSLVHAPALRLKAAETLSHTAASVAHLTARHGTDVAFVFNAANSPFLPWLRLLGIPTALHVDGLEWMRGKWSGAGQAYYKRAEAFAVRHADALIADARGIADYYSDTYGAPTELLAYGAPIVDAPAHNRLAALGLEPRRFHLVVARFEPENHVDIIVDGYRRSAAQHPLVVVGSAPYAERYSQQIVEAAASDPRIRFLGGVWDQVLLDQLYSNATSYAHGHSVGGTNPSLLRAMGGAAPVLAWDVTFNREVAGGDADFFGSAEQLAPLIERAEREPERAARRGASLRERARNLYDWDDVADGYENLGLRLFAGESIHERRRIPARTITTA
jgi:glycosyltransferase involved in cell wall biosynthesis